MRKLRMQFEKTGRAVYLSHLDLMHTIQRVFLRAGYPLKNSEGFNPHPVISIALPLSVGQASRCELLDFTLLDDDTDTERLRQDLNRAFPEGIAALEVYEPERKASAIKWVRVQGVYEYDDRPVAPIASALREFYTRGSLPVLRKTKRGEGVLDIAPYLRDLAVSAREGAVEMEATLSANEPTVNPELLVQALHQTAAEYAPDFARFTRLAIYDADLEIFR